MTHKQLKPPADASPPHDSLDLFNLQAGDLDPLLNKTIDEVIMTSATYFVYLATDLSIQWRTRETQQWAEGSGAVLNRVVILEARSRFIPERGALQAVRRQIAEGLVRCLDGGDIDGANVILHEVEGEIEARNREVSWSWYFHSAYNVASFSVVAIALLWLLRSPVQEKIGETAFHVLLGTLCGAIGALISATVRGDRIYLDANAGEKIHRLEGLSRVGAGLAGAALVALGIKSGALLGGMQFQGNQLALLLMFCIVAGASERLVPGLIEKFAKTIQSPQKPEPKAPVKSKARTKGKLPRT